MRITVLIENETRDPALACEHGLSLAVEYRGRIWLLDAGSSGAFAQNAQALGIALPRVEYAVLSHGHYDHGGGFSEFFARNGRAPVYAMRAAAEEYCSGDGAARHSIGIPEWVLPAFAGRFVWLDGPLEPAAGVTLLPHTTPGLSAAGAARKLYRGGGESAEPDDFRHELTVVFDTAEGLVVLNSCSHAGLPVILREVSNRFPGRPIRAFAGGLHMCGSRDGRETCLFTPGEVRQLADCVLRYDVREIYTGHCTGHAGYAALEPLLGGRLRPMRTGDRILLAD